MVWSVSKADCQSKKKVTNCNIKDENSVSHAPFKLLIMSLYVILGTRDEGYQVVLLPKGTDSCFVFYKAF